MRIQNTLCSERHTYTRINKPALTSPTSSSSSPHDFVSYLNIWPSGCTRAGVDKDSSPPTVVVVVDVASIITSLVVDSSRFGGVSLFDVTASVLLTASRLPSPHHKNNNKTTQALAVICQVLYRCFIHTLPGGVETLAERTNPLVPLLWRDYSTNCHEEHNCIVRRPTSRSIIRSDKIVLS